MAIRPAGILCICLLFVFGADSSLEDWFQQVTAKRAPRIYNGKLADWEEHRWMAWLYQKEQNAMVCMASLYSDRWVITSAACASKTFDHVVVGDYNMYESDGEQSIAIADVIKHPDFDAETHENDIALVKLAYKVDFVNGRAETLSRLSSSTLDDLEAKHCSMAGWGLTMSEEWLWPTASDLQELRIHLVNDSDCQDLGLSLPPTSFCFQSMRIHASPCMLDEGAPIVCEIRNKKTHVGIYSFYRQADGCKYGPKGATKISTFKSWIRKNTETQNVRPMMIKLLLRYLGIETRRQSHAKKSLFHKIKKY